MTQPSLALVAAAYWHAGVSDEDPPVWAQHEVPLQLARLREIDGVREVAIVATCNRTEVYLVADNISSAIQCVGVMRPGTYTLGGPEAAEHLLRVACGLESGILGDGQILGQVRQAYATARAARHFMGSRLSMVKPIRILEGRNAGQIWTDPNGESSSRLAHERALARRASDRG